MVANPTYPIPNRPPDFTIMSTSDDKSCPVNYWVEYVFSLDTFRLLYGYENGIFDEGLGLISVKNGAGKYSFSKGGNKKKLNTDHTIKIINAMREYLGNKFEMELLSDN